MGALDALLDARLSEAFTSPAAAQARRSLTPEQRKREKAARAPQQVGGGAYDESKHKRGAAGSSQGGQFVSKGASGSEVRSVQHRVGAKTDGKFGPKTEQAVRDFQRRHRLVVDGKVGHQTALALAGKYAKARSAKTGELRTEDRARLKGMRPTTTRGTAPTRSRGGVMV